ncbi:hypothetical protein J437_LFUL010724, partial [Ladona fulva]
MSSEDAGKTGTRPPLRGSGAETTGMDEDNVAENLRLKRQNQELRRTLEDEAASYKRRLESFRHAQQQQTALVGRLQAKVLQYKQRCLELEGRSDGIPSSGIPGVSSSGDGVTGTTSPEPMRHYKDYEDEGIHDLETALAKLEEERKKEINLRTEEERCSRLREDLLTVREELNGALLAKDLLEQQRSEGDSLMSQIEKSRGNKTKKQDWEKTHQELISQIAEMKKKQEETQMEVQMKEDKIQQLLREMQSLEERCGEAEQGIGQVSRLREEVELLQGALRDIARAVIQDSESRDDVYMGSGTFAPGAGAAGSVQPLSQHMHLTPTGPIPPRSDAQEALVKLEAVCNSIEQDKRKLQEDLRKVEEERASLQSINSDQLGDLGSLRKELLQAEQTRLDIESDKVKLQSSKEQLQVVKKQGEVAEQAQNALEKKQSELTQELDSLRSQLNSLNQEKEVLQKALDSCRTEKSNLEKSRQEVNQMSRYFLLPQMETLNNDYEKLQKSNLKLQKLCDNLEDEKLFLQAQHDQQAVQERLDEVRRELDEARAVLDRVRREATNKSEQDRLAINQLREEVSRLKSRIEEAKLNSEDEKARLDNKYDDIRKERDAVQSECEELKVQLHLAEDRHDGVQTQLHDTSRKLKEDICSHSNQVELELAQVSRERSELSGQVVALGRIRETLVEEAARTRQRLDQAAETNTRLNREIEALMRTQEERGVAIAAAEKESQRLTEQLAALRAEKEAVEGALFEAQSGLETAEERREAMETERQTLMVERESLRGKVARLSADLEAAEQHTREASASNARQIAMKEAEFQSTITNLKKQAEETANKLNEEKVRTSLYKQALTTAVLEKNMARKVERSRLQVQVRDLERAQLQCGQKIASLTEELEKAQNSQTHLLGEQRELRARLASESEEKDRAHQELHRLKKQIADMDANLEVTRGELNRTRMRVDAGEERWRNKEQELVGRLEEGRVRERKLEDRRHNLEVCLADASQQIQELKAKLGAAEGHLRALDSQLQQMETAKKETEQKLSSIGASLRRFAGIQPDGSVSLPFRLVSPSRSKWGLVRMENMMETLRKELTDTRRQLTDSNYEKDKYGVSNKELREHVKRIEGEKREGGRALEEAFQKIT